MIVKHSVIEDHEELSEVLKAYRQLQTKVCKLKDNKYKNGTKRDMLLKIRKDKMLEELNAFCYNFEKYVHLFLSEY